MVLGAILSACTTISGGGAQAHSFSVKPFGDEPMLRETRPQRSHRTVPEVTGDSFREVTIAQGSGLGGFETIRLFSDGSGYAVVRLSDTHAARVPIRLPPRQLALLVRAIQQDQLHRIRGMYSSGIADGTQGFVELVTSAGKVNSWLDNYFVPVAHLYAFCNEQIWPQVSPRLSLIRGRKYDSQEEYNRVFEN